MQNEEENRQRVVGKKEKVNKWEIPSYTHAGKSTDSPSQFPWSTHSSRAAASTRMVPGRST